MACSEVVEVREEWRDDGRVRGWRGTVRSKKMGEVEKVELNEDLIVETSHMERGEVVHVR